MNKVIATLSVYSMCLFGGQSPVLGEYRLIKTQSPFIAESPYCDHKGGENLEIFISKKILEFLEFGIARECNTDKCKFPENFKNKIISRMEKVLSEQVQKYRIEKYLFCPNYI